MSPWRPCWKRSSKGVSKDPIIIEAGPSMSDVKVEPSTSGTKKVKKSPKTPIRFKSSPGKRPKPGTEKKPSTSKSGGLKKAVLSAATKGVTKKIGIDPEFVDSFGTDDEGGYTPKGKGKGKQPKAKKTEAEKLKEGWQPWDKPLKRGGLDYGTDDDDTD